MIVLDVRLVNTLYVHGIKGGKLLIKCCNNFNGIETTGVTIKVGRTGAVVSVADYGPRVPGSRPGRGTVCCGLEQVTFTYCLVLVLVKLRKPWTDD